MGRPAEQIEALQARVRELEGRCRAYESERAHLFSVIGPQCKEPDDKGFPCCYPTWPKHDDHNGKAGPYATEEIRAAYFAANPRPWDATPADVPPVLVAGDVLDEGRAAWFAEIGLKAPTPDELQAAMSAPSLLVPPPEVEHCADCGDAFEGFHACQKHIGEDEGSDP